MPTNLSPVEATYKITWPLPRHVTKYLPLSSPLILPPSIGGEQILDDSPVCQWNPYYWVTSTWPSRAWGDITSQPQDWWLQVGTICVHDPKDGTDNKVTLVPVPRNARRSHPSTRPVHKHTITTTTIRSRYHYWGPTEELEKDDITWWHVPRGYPPKGTIGGPAQYLWKF